MEGWAELFKHFLSSKLSSACLFVAATVLCFGHNYAQWIPEVPDGWRWIAFGVMVFTACQCVWWIFSAICQRILKSCVKIWKVILPVRIQQLSKEEKYLLGFATAASGQLDLQRLEEHRQFERDVNAPEPIVAKVAASNLLRLGLIDYNMMGGYYMTDMGNRFVVKYHEPVRS